MQRQTEGIEIEDLDCLEDRIRRIITVLGSRDAVLTRSKTSLEQTLTVGVLLQFLAGLHIDDLDCYTTKSFVRTVIIHIDSHTWCRCFRIFLGSFLLTRQVEPHGYLRSHEERIDFGILGSCGSIRSIDGIIKRADTGFTNRQLHRYILRTVGSLVAEGIEHTIVRKDRETHTRLGVDPLVEVNTDLRRSSYIESEVHGVSGTIDLLVVHQGMFVHIGEPGNELVILDGGSEIAFQRRTAEESVSHFDTGLPEERHVFMLHTKEDRHLSKTADDLLADTGEVIGIMHRVIGLHLEGTIDVAVVRTGEVLDGIIERELHAGGEDKLLVAQLVTETGTATYKTFVLQLKTEGIRLRLRSRLIGDAGGEEFAISDESPETETMRDVTIVIGIGFRIRFIDSRYSSHVLRLLLSSGEGRLSGLRLSGLGRSSLSSSFGLLLFGFRLLSLLLLFLLLRSSFRLLFLPLSSRFLTLLGSFGFGFLALLGLLCLLFLSLCFRFRSSIHCIDSCHRRVQYRYCGRSYCHAQCHQKYVSDSFHRFNGLLVFHLVCDNYALRGDNRKYMILNSVSTQRLP